MHCHCGTNNRAPRWTFTDPCKPEVRPGAREESASPAWLAAPTMNARDTTKVYILQYGGLTLNVDRHYIGSVTATTHQEIGIITLESKPSRGTVLPAPHGKGNEMKKKPHSSLYKNYFTVDILKYKCCFKLVRIHINCHFTLPLYIDKLSFFLCIVNLNTCACTTKIRIMYINDLMY